MEAVVAKVKEMQRVDPGARDQWQLYCDSQAGGMRDPARHSFEFVHSFVTNYQAGMRFEPLPSVGGKSNGSANANLGDLFKTGQRHSGAWKEAWTSYCDVHANGRYDPLKHDVSFLTGFMEFLGQRAVVSMQMGTEGGISNMGSIGTGMGGNMGEMGGVGEMGGKGGKGD
eukprot:CAMPEP_0117545056 /NCGR_PEP_ID=MMETSP0784-20121206/45897_1 /TAXON_ID=39447 /ORGANISM="" /LENGTH=169 /DNA_ID=CAMNT_0005341889 /DNA_START=57 /DNA_END=563 /DNA_ORIENTATION=-